MDSVGQVVLAEGGDTRVEGRSSSPIGYYVSLALLAVVVGGGAVLGGNSQGGDAVRFSQAPRSESELSPASDVIRSTGVFNDTLKLGR